MESATADLLVLLLETLPVAILAFDPTGTPLFANDRARSMLGDGIRPGANFQGELYHPFLAGTDQAYPRDEIPIIRALRGEEANAADLELRRPEGVLSVAAWAKPVRDATGAIVAAVSTFVDITETRHAERALAEAESLFRGAFSNAPTGMALVAMDGAILRVNDSLCTMLGYSEPVLLERNVVDLAHPEDRHIDDDDVREVVRGRVPSYTVDRRYVRCDGIVVWCRQSVSVVRNADGDPQYFITHLQDVTSERASRDRLRDAAHTDELTQLANRRRALEAVASAQAAVHATGTHAAVVYIDLDGFKRINDTYGHDSGDQVLIEVAARLRSCLRPTDTAARLGGDEFLCCLAGLGDSAATAEEHAVVVSRRLANAINQPVVVNGHELDLRASIGFATADGVSDPLTIIATADRNMYEAKARRRGGA